MTFLNPIFLFGLGAAAIPIIIHLLNLRKIRTIDFSTLTFLKELEKSHLKRLKLRQILLLLLRTFFIIFLVLVFSRPAYIGTGAIPGHRANSVVAILLDNSPSMNVYDQDGNLFRRSLERVNIIIDSMNEGDKVIFIRQNDLPEPTFTANIGKGEYTRQEIRNTVNETEISAIHRNFGKAFKLVDELFSNLPHLNKELYIISDMQSTHWDDFTNETMTTNPKIFILPVGNDIPENLAVGEVEILTSIFKEGKPIRLRAEIRNYGRLGVSEHPVTVYLNKKRVAQKSLSIPAGQGVVAELSIVPESSGFNAGYVQIGDDALSIDNRSYFIFLIPESINILLLSHGINDVKFIKASLEAAGENGSIKYDHVTDENFPAIELNNYDLIISVNVPEWSDIQAERLGRFISNGGGFILFPGDALDLQNYNRGLLRILRLPEYIGFSGNEREDKADAEFNLIDYDHPLFEGMFRDAVRGSEIEGEIESPQIFRYIRMKSAIPEDFRIIILSNEETFLSGGERGSGRYLMFNIKPTLDWSNFPVRGIFIPLIHRSILYVSATDHAGKSFIAGEEFTIDIPTSRIQPQLNNRGFTLIHPDGIEEIVLPEYQTPTGFSHIDITSAAMPGIFYVRTDDDTVETFAVNVHPGESDPGRLSKNETEDLLGTHGISDITFIDTVEDAVTVIHESRFGVELWKIFLFLAITTLLFETLIAGRYKF